MRLRFAVVPFTWVLAVLAAGCGGSSKSSSSSSSNAGPAQNPAGTIAFGTSYTGNKDSASCLLHGVKTTFTMGETIADRVAVKDKLAPAQSTTQLVDSNGAVVLQQLGSHQANANVSTAGGCGKNTVATYATALKNKSGTYTFKLLRTSDKKIEAQGTVTFDFSASTQTSSQASSTP